MDFIIFVMKSPLLVFIFLLLYYYGLIIIMGWIGSKLLDKFIGD
jgi:hypothetical protein